MFAVVATLGILANVCLPTHHFIPSAPIVQATTFAFEESIGGEGPPRQYALPYFGHRPVTSPVGYDDLDHHGWGYGERFRVDLAINETGSTRHNHDDFGDSDVLAHSPGNGIMVGNVWSGDGPVQGMSKTIATRQISPIRSDIYYEFQVDFTVEVGYSATYQPVYKSGLMGLGIHQYARVH